MNILKILFLLVFISFFKPSEECSNIYLIRHAEKVRTDKSDRDPDLNKNGFLRAINWKNYFSDKNISRIYSTNYKRTIKKKTNVFYDVFFESKKLSKSAT